MDTINLKLPSTLRSSLNYRAKSEGVSLNQYLIYALTEHISSTRFYAPIPRHDLKEQRERFNELVASLGNPTDEEIEAAFDNRENGERDPELDPAVEKGLRAIISERLKSEHASY